MRKRLSFFLFLFIIAILVLSTIAAAGFWQDITGMFSLSKFFKPKAAQQTIPPAEKAVTTECKAYIDGKCATELQPKLNMNLQKSAKAYTLETQKAKTVSGKAVKVSKTEKTITRNVKIGTLTKDVKVPVVNVCINNKCKEYGIDETIEIAGVVYDLVLSKDKINLLPQGISLISPHEEDISEFEIPPASPVPLQAKILISSLSPMPIRHPHIFKVGVIIDRDTIPYSQATRAEIEEAIALANVWLAQRNTNIKFVLHDIQNVNMGGYDSYGETSTALLDDYADTYYMTHIASPPNGIVIFREDPRSSSYGGYGGMRSSNLRSYGFYNLFSAPRSGNSFIYISVIDWDHMYASCGYDDNFHENRISDVSTDYACNNSNGIPCQLHNGYYMCPDIDERDLYARDRLSFVAATIIHEFLHSFHPEGITALSSFHGPCAEDCPERITDPVTGYSCDSDWPYPIITFWQSYVHMCPSVWEEFTNSWQGNLNYSDSCNLEDDMCKSNTFCESWSADVSNYRCSCLNNEACEYERVCTRGRCKIPTGRECDTRRADLCITGHCTLTAGQRFKGTCSI